MGRDEGGRGTKRECGIREGGIIGRDGGYVEGV